MLTIREKITAALSQIRSNQTGELKLAEISTEQALADFCQSLLDNRTQLSEENRAILVRLNRDVVEIGPASTESFDKILLEKISQITRSLSWSYPGCVDLPPQIASRKPLLLCGNRIFSSCLDGSQIFLF